MLSLREARATKFCVGGMGEPARHASLGEAGGGQEEGAHGVIASESEAIQKPGSGVNVQRH